MVAGPLKTSFARNTEEHNLKFSTDPDPNKCKTKCIAFLKTARDIAPLQLCGDPLPWVDHGKHLGIFYQNKMDGLKHDIKVKRAKYIDRNNELIQEYSFAHAKTKFKMNLIFNSHFSGSQVWDLFSPECALMEATWNRSIKLMFDLPLQTHHYFICPISESQHVKHMLIKRFISFTLKLESSKKCSVRHLYKVVKNDAQTTTGSNIRNIQILIGKEDQKLSPNDAMKVKYHEVKEEDEWKVKFVKEVIEVKQGTLDVGLENSEIEDILEHLCTS